MTSAPARSVDVGLAALRSALILDALTFLTAASLNFGVSIPLGFVTLAFRPHIIQAGIGEAVIGVALLAAGLTMRRGLSWLAFWLSVGGIVFGLIATSARRGPEWDVHLILVPLAILTVGLLLWTGRGLAGSGSGADAGARTNRVSLPRALIGLMLVTACTLLVASAIHFGPRLPLGFVTVYDPYPGARIPEAVLGILVAAGAAFAFTGRAGSREMAVAAAVFTLLLSLYGLITTNAARTGDIAYHITLLVMLATIILWLLFSGRVPRTPLGGYAGRSGSTRNRE